jgi:hypothetical protein
MGDEVEPRREFIEKRTRWRCPTSTSDKAPRTPRGQAS